MKREEDAGGIFSAFLFRPSPLRLTVGRAETVRSCGVPPRAQLGHPCVPKVVVRLGRRAPGAGDQNDSRVSPAPGARRPGVNDLGPKAEVSPADRRTTTTMTTPTGDVG